MTPFDPSRLDSYEGKPVRWKGRVEEERDTSKRPDTPVKTVAVILHSEDKARYYASLHLKEPLKRRIHNGTEIVFEGLAGKVVIGVEENYKYDREGELREIVRSHLYRIYIEDAELFESPKRTSNEDAAAGSLRVAKALIKARAYAVARGRLKELIAKYEGTEPAEEAKTLLKELRSK